MQQSPNRFTQFWQELKRRKVIKVVAMYAATAFIILEVVDIVLPRLGMPDWTVTLIIVLLIVGFPITIILSWIFDITPGGLTKTESVNVMPEEEPTSKPIKRKLKASDIIIVVLVIIVGILAYPRIFKKNASLNAMTIPITVVNELGEKEIRKVFKENYITKLAVFPFANESKDTLEDWLSYGIFEVLTEELQQFGYLSLVGNEYATHLQEKISFAETNGFSLFLTGVYEVVDNDYEITTRIYQTTNGTLLSERTYRGNDFFGLADSMSLQVRIDIGIPKNQMNSSSDLPSKELLTKNLDAFRYYVKGYYVDSLFTYSQKAIDLDSTFALALYFRAANSHNHQVCNKSAEKFINQAMRHRHRLSEYREIFTRILYYLIHGENEQAIALLERQYEFQSNNIQLLHELYFVYDNNFMIHKYEEAVKKLNKLLPGVPRYQIRLARSYLFTGKLEKGLKVLEKILKENPENSEALMMMGEIYLHMNDLDAAENAFQTAIMLNPEDEKFWSKMLTHIEYIRNNPVDIAFLEPFMGEYRFESSEFVISNFIHNNYLLLKAKNQGASFQYPVSDSQFISPEAAGTITAVTNEQGNVIKLIHEQSNLPPYSDIIWKEDSLILKAKSTLQEGNHTEALLAFQKAYIHNPEHFYLTNFIQHLELILSPEYAELEPVINTCLGNYSGDLTLYLENNQYYCKDSKLGFIDRILPISEESFMFPGLYDRQIHTVKENDAVTGLKYVHLDGDERYFERISEQALASKNQ